MSHLQSLDAPNARPIATVPPGGSVIGWSGDGRSVFLQHTDPEQASADILRLDVRTGHSSKWRQLRVPEAGASLLGAARLPADGESYACSFQLDLATLYLVKGVK